MECLAPDIRRGIDDRCRTSGNSIVDGDAADVAIIGATYSEEPSFTS